MRATIGTALDQDGRIPVGAECTTSDGRHGFVVRRGPIKDAFTLAMGKDGGNEFRKVRIYTAIVRTDDGEKVRQERIRIDPSHYEAGRDD